MTKKIYMKTHSDAGDALISLSCALGPVDELGRCSICEDLNECAA